MPLYVVTFQHPDEEGWTRHVIPHVHFLEELLKTGELVASGPFTGTPVKSAMLIMKAPDREALMAVIKRDPFWTEGLIEDMTVTEWDPLFGALQDLSSRKRG